MAILDAFGRPVDTRILTQELARGSNVSPVRPIFHIPVSMSLTPERLAGIILSVDQGNIIHYLTLAEEMEERDLHYHSVIGTRKNAVVGLQTVVEAATDDPKDVEIADAVTLLTKDDGWANLLADLMSAINPGFGVDEIVWDTSGSQWWPKRYEFRDPRHFRFDWETQQELRLLDVIDPVFGIPLAPFKFIQHRPHIKTGLPIRGGLARLACVAFMCKGYALKDWISFAEVYGHPLRLGRYGEGATPEQKDALLSALTNIGVDAAAMIPESMKMEIITQPATNSGDKIFEGLADWIDSQVSKAVLGQTMTSDAKGAGLGSNQADVHNEVRKDIRDADARHLSATLMRDLVRPFVELNYGPQAEYPHVYLKAEEAEDLKLLSEALPPFIDRGLAVEASVIREKFNLPSPAAGAELLQPSQKASPFGGAAPGLPHELGAGKMPNAPQPGQKELSAAQRSAAIAIVQKVVAGDTLTADQRELIRLASAQHGDSIDQLTAEGLTDAERVLAPMLAGIQHIVNASGSLEDAHRRIAAAKLDTSELVKAVALLTFKARGLGSATDKP